MTNQDMLNAIGGNTGLLACIDAFPGEMISMTMVRHEGVDPLRPVYGNILRILEIRKFYCKILTSGIFSLL